MRHDGKTTYDELIAIDGRWGHDVKAPDGMMAGGWRLVRKGGMIRAFGGMYQHDALLPFVGRRVWVTNSDYWRSNFDVMESRRRTEGRPMGGFICRIYT